MSEKIKTEKKEKSMKPGLLALAGVAVTVAAKLLFGNKSNS